MTPDEVFEAWAPDSSPWSAWAKPVLFACLAEGDLDVSRDVLPALLLEELWGTQSAPPSAVAVIVDLPGAESVAAGLALSQLGFSPVPLFNALPGDPESLVDVVVIQRALVSGVEALRARSLPNDAPPAFLLDSLRRTSRHAVAAGRFDNRSVAFDTDFPSAARLTKAGITHALLLRQGPPQAPGDLVSTLAGWHAAGIVVEVNDIAGRAPAHAWAPPRLPWIRRFWFQTFVPLALRRKPTGEFGGVVPASG